MKVRAIDKNGDWQFGHSLGSYKTSHFAVEQNLKTRLLEWFGDCFFNVNAGIDYKNLLSNRSNQPQLEESIRNVILGTSGVKQLTTLTIDFNEYTRGFFCEYSVLTIFSTQITDTITPENP